MNSRSIVRSMLAFAPVFKWQLFRMRRWLPTLIAFQVVIGVGVALGLGNLLVNGDQAGRQYLVSGVAINVLLATGVVIAPSLVYRSRENGAMEYLALQSFPKAFLLFSDLIIWCLVAVPGAAFSVAVAAWHFSVDLRIRWEIAPVAVVTVSVGVALGYLIGLLAPTLAATNMISNALLLVLMLYTPISFAASNLDDWLVDLQRILPFWHLADLFRGYVGLDNLTEFHRSDSWLCVGAWAVVASTSVIALLTFPRMRWVTVS